MKDGKPDPDHIPKSNGMFVEMDRSKYHIRRGPSIWTNRKGKEDCWIGKRNTWGSRESDGNLYSGVAVIACETGEFLRNWEVLPKEINSSMLLERGLIDIGICV